MNKLITARLASSYVEEREDIVKINHFFYIMTGLLVAFLWSTSFVIIKIGLNEIDPITFVAYRYIFASFILLGLVITSNKAKQDIKHLSRKNWLEFSFYGLVFITITQGAGFISLELLPVITVSFMLTLTVIIVILFSIPLLNEHPTKLQLGLILFMLINVGIYFLPLKLAENEQKGLIVLVIALLANAFSQVYGRHINRFNRVSPLVITAISMSVGSIVLGLTSLLIYGIPNLSMNSWLIVVFLAVVNTAFTFLLWNKVLQRLTAIEVTLIQNTMLPQITVLAIIFLDDSITLKQGVAIFFIFLSSLLVPITKLRRLNQR